MTSNVATLLAETLIANGIDQLYCLPGIQNDQFFDALFDRTDRLRPIHTRHEQGAAYMALGAALATGKPQAYCVVPGPGFLNTTAALCTAYAVNAPVLALAGQIPLGAVGKQHGLLHEIPDQLAVLDTLTKQSARVTGGDDAGPVLQQAFSALKSGRPRPVGVEIPVSAWASPVKDASASLVAEPAASPAVDTDKIEQAARLIANAEAPMIVVGSGARNSSAGVNQLSELLGAPVLNFRNGKGVVSSEQPLSIGLPVGHDLWPSVDVVIGLGTRLQSQVMAWGSDDQLKIVHIAIDAEQLGRSAKPDVAIHADLADALPLLIEQLQGKQRDRKAWGERVASTKAGRAAQYQRELAPQMAWIAAIRDELPRDGIFVDELTQIGYVSRFAFPCYAPRTFLSTGYQGTLGYGIATALGAAHARRDVPVVNISGDGGALFTITELATAVHHQIPLTTIVFNDNAFGNVRRLQMDDYNSRFIASELTSPDFVALARSFGAQGLRAATPDELRLRLREAFKSDGPTVIEVPVAEEMPSPWPFVLMPKVRG